MNKRLKELTEQAGFVRFSPEEDPHTPIDWSSDYAYELDKFAELIINECAEVAGCNGHVSGFTLGDLIKEHFGGSPTPRSQVEIDLEDDEIFQLMKLAHKRDITFNQLVEMILQEAIRKHENKEADDWYENLMDKEKE